MSFYTTLLPLWRRTPRWLRKPLTWLHATKFAIGVSSVCLNPRGELLLLEHRFHADNPWGLPGGWLEAGESPEEGAQRELREETGLVPTQIELLHVHPLRYRLEFYFFCRVPDGPIQLQASELSAYRWVDPAAPGVSLYPLQRGVVGLARQRMARAGVPPH